LDIERNLNREPVTLAGPIEPFCVDPQVSIRAVFDGLKAHKAVGCALVCRAGVLEGIFTERDALALMADRRSLDAPVESVMIKNPVSVKPTDTVGHAIRLMSKGGYRRLPIVDAQHRPIGLLGVTQIVHYLVQYFPKSVYNLPPTPRPAMAERDGA
jgi:CBS domain-containing protein